MQRLTTLYAWVTESSDEPRREVVACVALPHGGTRMLVYSNVSSEKIRQQCDELAVLAAEQFNEPMRLVRFDFGITVQGYPQECAHTAVTSCQHCAKCGAHIPAQPK